MLENVYFIVGPHGVGKTYFINEVRKERELLHLDTGPIIRDVHSRSKSSLPFGEWMKYGETCFGKDFSNIVLLKRMEQLLLENNYNGQDLFITGNRTIAGINYMIEHLNISNPVIIYLDSSFENLKNNYETREQLSLSDKQFAEVINEEKKRGLADLKKYVLDNPDKCLYVYRENNEDVISDELIKKIRGFKNSQYVFKR